MIKVLIVDDSAVVRKVLTDELSKYDGIEIVGTAVDPYAARDKIVKLKPDVITLDLEMPKMDGLSFLAKLMKFNPMPVIVVSSVAPENSENALRALDLGAVDVISKPGGSYSTVDISKSLARSIRIAASARIKAYPDKSSSSPKKPQIHDFGFETTNRVIAIGASTGGTKAIEVVLASMPAISPGTLIVQHMPEKFTTTFAGRLNEICQMEVREAKDNDHVVPGVALLAPGNYHMVLNRNGGNYSVKIKEGPRVHYQRPAVDVLFHSVAKSAGRNAIGVLLTGMGADGATGLLKMKQTGSFTIAQDEKTSVVFGMPKEAIKLGAAAKVVPLQDVSRTIINALQKKKG